MDNTTKIVKAICDYEAAADKKLLAQCVKLAKLWNAHDDRSRAAGTAMAAQVSKIRGNKGKLGYEAFKARITAGNWVIVGGFTDEQVLSADWTITEMQKCLKIESLKEANEAGNPIKWEDIEARGAFIRPVVEAPATKHAPLSKAAKAALNAHTSPIGSSVLQDGLKLTKKILEPASCASLSVAEMQKLVDALQKSMIHVSNEKKLKESTIKASV